MTAAMVVGRGLRAPGDLGLPVLTVEAVGGRPREFDRLLVVGSTADLARVAASAGHAAIAFSGAPEISRLFALDASLKAARERLDRGTPYPFDLGMVECSTSRAPFLAAVTAGAGSGGGLGFPWAGSRGAVGVRTDRRTVATRGRAVVAANAQHWKRWTVAPRAAGNDSRLEVQVFAGSRLALWSLRRALALGLHDRLASVTRVVAPAAEVSLPAGWQVRADGLTVGRGTFRVTLAAGAATFLV